MTSSGHRIARNAGTLMIAQVVTWALTFAGTVAMARYLGAQAIGQLQVANSIWVITATLVAFGNDVLLTKEIARAPEQTATLLSTSLIMRTLLHILGTLAVAVYVWLGGYSPTTMVIVFVVGLVNLAGQYSSATRTALQGLERMEYISLADIGSKFAGTVGIIGVLLLGQGAVVVAAVGLVAALASVGMQAYFLHRLRPLHLRLDLRALLRMVRAGLPYLLTSLVLKLYLESDTLIISHLANETQVGWYGAAMRLLGTFVFVPSIFMTAVFPAITRLHQQDRAAQFQLMRRSSFWLLAISLPLGLGIAVIATPLVSLIYGADFYGTAPIVVAVGLGMLFSYQNIVIGKYFIAVDRQNTWTTVMVIAMVLKFGLNLVLIPWFARISGNGGLGAAAGLLITEIAMTIVGLVLLPKGMFGRETAWAWLRLLLAGLGMAAAVAPLRQTFILVPIVVGVLTYFGLLWALRVVPAREWETAKALGKTMWLRLRRIAPAPSRAGG